MTPQTTDSAPPPSQPQATAPQDVEGALDTHRQLQSLLQEQLDSLKQTSASGIPRLLSPAPIGHGACPSKDSAESSRRASPNPPLTTARSPLLDFGSANGSTPSTPKRNAVSGISRGLSLQLPTGVDSPGTGATKSDLRSPLTPKLDTTISYGSPGSVLPRRSRGMDFSRAATHLHHSTIAEKPDPESSPLVSGRGVNVPRRPGSMYDSPMRGGVSNNGFEQSAISSSVGSISMMDSGSDSSSDDDIAMREEDEAFLTPQAGRLGVGGSGHPLIGPYQSPGGEALRRYTAADGRNYRDKLRSGRSSRKGSDTKRNSSGWKYDWMISPGFQSPPVHRSIEGNDSYFQRDFSRRNIQSRRESLSLGTNELTIDDSTPGSEETHTPSDAMAATESSTEGRKNVIKRAVTTRRSHLIPKSKGFSRIRAALMEESAPVDVENRREAEVIRQVKERDEYRPEKHEEAISAISSQPATGASSPCLAPASTTGPTDSPDDISEINLDTGGHQPSTRRSSSSFSVQASRYGAGPDFFNRFFDDERMRTPPPPLPPLFTRDANPTSVFGEDVVNMSLDGGPAGGAGAVGISTAMQTGGSTGPPPLWPSLSSLSRNSSSGGNPSPLLGASALPLTGLFSLSGAGRRKPSSGSGSRSETPTTGGGQASSSHWPPALGKRRRDDELDSEFFKRRAVSPGLSSIAGSPILPPSPAQRENNLWSRNSADSPAAGGAGSGKKDTPNSSGNNVQLPPPAAGTAPPGSRGTLAGSGSSSGVGGGGSGGNTGSCSTTTTTTTMNTTTNTNTNTTGTGGSGMERRVGMQGMNEAGEGLMNMSIE